MASSRHALPSRRTPFMICARELLAQGRSALGSARSWAVVLAAVMPGCARPQVAAPSDAGPSAVDHGPALVLSEQEHDFGRAVQGDVLRCVVRVTNAGPTPLSLATETSGERCHGQLDRSLLGAGEIAELDVSCALSQHHGALRETVIVRANAALSDAAPSDAGRSDPGPADAGPSGEPAEAALQIRAEVTPLLAFDTDMLSFEVALGAQGESSIGLVGTRAGDARLKLRRVDHPFFEVSVGSVGTPSAARVRVRARGASVGYHAGTLVFDTGIAEPTTLALPYAVRVRGALSVSPTNPYFNLRDPGPKLRMIEVESAEPDFQVRSVQVTDGPFTATLESVGKGHARVRVQVSEHELEDETRGAIGHLSIRSNDRAEPLKVLPLFAFGLLNRYKPDAGVGEP
jgi:hypothetical protein